MAERSRCRFALHAEPVPEADRALRVDEPDLPVLRYRHRDRWSDRYQRLVVLAGRIGSSLWQNVDPLALVSIPVVVSANRDCRLDVIAFGRQDVVNRLSPPSN